MRRPDRYIALMSFAEIKTQVEQLSWAERESLLSVLMDLQEENSEERKQKLAAKINDKDPANWMTLEEFSKRLREDEKSEGSNGV